MALRSRLANLAAAASLTLLSSLAGAQALNVPAVAQARAAGIFDDKASRTAAEKKLDEKLLFAHRAMRIGARRNAVTPGIPGFVQGFIDRDVGDDLATFVTIRAAGTAELAAWLQASGARDVRDLPQFDSVTATVPVALLPSLAERPDVLYVGSRERGRTNRYLPKNDPRYNALANAMAPIANVGPVTWKGVTAHQANLAHSTGITGVGVKVCVLSDGVDSLAARQAAGELPAGITVLSGQGGSGDEGTAMLEIIHDMAPGAALGFATATPSSSNFAANIVALRNTSACDIIVDGYTYLLESAFQDDNVAQAVNQVTAAGALYFSSAGDSGNLTHVKSGTFEGDYVQSAVAVPAVITAIDPPPSTGSFLHEFPSGNAFTTLTQPTEAITLKWSDANVQSGNDYDLFVTDPGATTIYGSSTQGQQGTQNPREIVSCDIAGPGPCDSGGNCNPGTGEFCAFPVGSRIYILKWEGSTRALRLDTNGGVLATADWKAGSTFGHNAAANALSVGAASLAGVAGTDPFTPANAVNDYSSDGPRKVFYNAAGTAITPGNVLFGTSGGTTLPKVDLAAGDCGATSSPGYATFCGTSAAAPGAAAIAALIKSAKPSATRAQVLAALLASTVDIEQAGVDRNSGAGIVMVPAAVRSQLVALTFGKSYSPATISAGANSTLTITVTNPNTVTLNGIAFTDTYPSPIVNATSPGAAVNGAGCTASLSATGGGNTLAVTNATIPGGTTCTFTVVVKVSAAGTYSDTSGTLTTPIGLNTTGTSTGSLTVTAPTTQRAFVASYGNDANTNNNCSFTSPCRSFTSALTVLIPGGEIIALNAAGYGAVTIEKSVTIVANPGFYAGITAGSGDAITISAPGVSVLLRGLNINGTGGVNGVNMIDGVSLTMDNCVVTNFSGSGVRVNASGAGVRISNSVFSGNGIDGLQVIQGKADVVRSRANGNTRAGFAAVPGDGNASTLTVTDSLASGNDFGFFNLAFCTACSARLTLTRVTGVSSGEGVHNHSIGGTATTIVGNSMFTQNNIGMSNTGGTLRSLADNLVDLNSSSNTSGTITNVPGL